MSSIVTDEEIVPKLALDYVLAKAVRPSFSYRDIWREEHRRAFTVAKMMTDDLLEFMQAEIAQAIASGNDFKGFSKRVEPRLMQAGWWGQALMDDPKTGETKLVQLGSPSRLKLIYEQNIRTAYAVQSWQDVEEADAIEYLEYRIGPSKEHRAQHVAWNGLILPKSDPFWNFATPPNGFNCRCSVIGVTEFRLRKTKREVSQSPKLTPVMYRNKRTGQMLRGFEEIDPGFEFNPGKLSAAALRDKMREKNHEMLTSSNVHMCRVCG